MARRMLPHTFPTSGGDQRTTVGDMQHGWTAQAWRFLEDASPKWQLLKDQDVASKPQAPGPSDGIQAQSHPQCCYFVSVRKTLVQRHANSCRNKNCVLGLLMTCWRRPIGLWTQLPALYE